MFGLSKITTTDHRPTAADRPELWIPENIEPLYGEALERVRASVTPLSAVEWIASLRGSDLNLLGVPRADADPTQGPLGAHVRQAIAVRDHGGRVPGSVGDPRNTRRYAYGPNLSQQGKTFQKLQSFQLPPDEHEMQAFITSENARESFEAEVASVVHAVLSDPERAWEAFIHLSAIEDARTELDRRAEEKKRQRQEDAVIRCPICQERNGEIGTRSVEPDYAPRPYSRALRIRSCLPCWHEARAAQQQRRANEVLSSGQTRAERISQWLDEASGRTDTRV